MVSQQPLPISGTVSLTDYRSINNNAEHWDNPTQFQPERYLNYPLPAAAYINAADPNDRDHFSYGAGRRVCPGVHLAEKSLYLNIARVLWAFNLNKKKDSDGQVIEPEAGMVPGWMTIPLPFKCEITVRSDQKKALIEKIWTEAKKGLKADGDIPDGQGYQKAR